MKTRFLKMLGLAAMAAWGAAAFAQSDWGFDGCFDPENEEPRSTDHLAIRVFNQLFHAATGVSGTATYGGQNGPCFAPTAVTMNLPGGFGFMSGTLGSVQDSNPADPDDVFEDDNLVYTFGMPFDPARPYSLVTVVDNGAHTFFGSSGFGFFNGLSGRYYQITTNHGDIAITVRVDVIGDAAKVQWTLRNTNATDTHNVGLWFGQTMGMLTNSPAVTDINGASMSFQNLSTNAGFGPKLGFVELPTGRPPLTDRRFIRNVDPVTFPQYVNFLFGQTASYGLRVDNGPTPETSGIGGSEATQVDEFVIGKQSFLLGDESFGDAILPDTGMRNNTAYIQKFNEEPVLPGQARIITQYFRTPWGNGNYAEPYTVVVDAPQIVASDPNGVEGLRPNPMTFRVYVDNAQNFAQIGNEVPLEDVSIRLTFPTGQLFLSPGEQETKLINQVPARQIRFVDFSVETDGTQIGDLPYRVEVISTPGGSKTIDGIVKVSATPRLEVVTDANLISIPWAVTDTSYEAILGLESPQDFRAYRWDPQQQGYIVATNARRGWGDWIVSNAEFGPVPLQGNPTAPPDIATGAPNIQLKAGWNIIGNPYPYPIQLNQIIGVPNGSGQTVRTWAELVAAGFVGAALVYYDTDLGDYVYIQGNDAFLQPHKGYWIFLNTQQDLTLSYPPVFTRGIPDSPRRPNNQWAQSERQWRLQLAVRSEKSQDTQNYVGVVPSPQHVVSNRLPEIPMTPIQNVSISVEDLMGNRAMRMSQAYTDRATRRTWKVFVQTTEATTATITWPNMATIPKNVRFRITDLATNTSRDLRNTSGYTFTTNGAGSREFKLEVIPGGTARAVIGNVLVSRPGRDRQAPFTIKYTLSSDANTTIRILAGSGREVFTVTRGRADRAGENEAVWTMRDNANRLVAPGTYRVELIAETAEGDRVRKIVPINVVR